jgi:heterodisulfide reductase subunit B
MAHNSMADQMAGNEACQCNTCTAVKERATRKLALNKAQYQFTNAELKDLVLILQFAKQVTSPAVVVECDKLTQTINQILADRSK